MTARPKTEDVSDENWSAVVIWPFGLTHLVQKSRLTQTIADLVSRDIPHEAVEVMKIPEGGGWTIDYPGMIWTGRHMMEVKIDTLALRIPAYDVGNFILQIRKLPLRKFKDGVEYYKLKGFAAAVVLSPDQRDALQEALELVYEEAQEYAEQDIQKQYELRKDLGETGHFPKVKLMNRDTSKN